MLVIIVLTAEAVPLTSHFTLGYRNPGLRTSFTLDEETVFWSRRSLRRAVPPRALAWTA
jgi:hypothetical protein